MTIWEISAVPLFNSPPQLRDGNFFDKKPLSEKCLIRMIKVVWDTNETVSKDRVVWNTTKWLRLKRLHISINYKSMHTQRSNRNAVGMFYSPSRHSMDKNLEKKIIFNVWVQSFLSHFFYLFQIIIWFAHNMVLSIPI